MKIYASGSSFLLLVLLGAGEITQSINGLLYKREDLTSIPRTHTEERGVAMLSCHPMARSRDTGRSLGFSGQPA